MPNNIRQIGSRAAPMLGDESSLKSVQKPATVFNSGITGVKNSDASMVVSLKGAILGGFSVRPERETPRLEIPPELLPKQQVSDESKPPLPPRGNVLPLPPRGNGIVSGADIPPPPLLAQRQTAPKPVLSSQLKMATNEAPPLPPRLGGLAARRMGGNLKLSLQTSPKTEQTGFSGLLGRLGTSRSDSPFGLYKQLMAQVGPSFDPKAKFLSDVSAARFKDIPTASATQVIAPGGKPLAANRVQVNGQNVAIASQYPKSVDLESYFRMLVDNRTPVLVVLASENDISSTKSPLPPYFSKNDQYGEVSVTSERKKTITLEGDDVDVKIALYNLTVRIPGDKPANIPVLHVQNWPDHTGLKPEMLKALAERMSAVKNEKIDSYNSYKKLGSRAVGDPQKLLPVIHCRAGVGRTGQLIAASELLKPESKGLESIVTDMRKSRNPQMVQTEEQLKGLYDLEQQLKQK